MIRVTICILFTVSGLVSASRDTDKKDNVHISVSPSHFQMSEQKAKSGGFTAGAAALAQLRENIQAQPEGRATQAATSEANEEARSRVRAKLHQVGLEHERLTAKAGKMEMLMHDQFAQMFGEQAKTATPHFSSKEHYVGDNTVVFDPPPFPSPQALSQSLAELRNDVSQSAAVSGKSEEEALKELEHHTAQLLQWRDAMGRLKDERDAMWVRKSEAIREALRAGMSLDDIQNELGGSVAAPAPPAQKEDPLDNSGKERQELMAAERADELARKQQAGEPVREAAHKDEASAKKQQLANVMANSAVEMAQIESAATDVMNGLDDFKKWKGRDDNSPQSLLEAKKVKEKLDKAIRFLKEHEGMIDQRTSQINDLLRETGHGHL
jgi:hypothetical protein